MHPTQNKSALVIDMVYCYVLLFSANSDRMSKRKLNEIQKNQNIDMLVSRFSSSSSKDNTTLIENAKNLLLSENVSDNDKRKLLNAIHKDRDQNRKISMLVSWFSRGKPAPPNTNNIATAAEARKKKIRDELTKYAKNLLLSKSVSDNNKRKLWNAIRRGPISQLPEHATQTLILDKLPRSNQIRYRKALGKPTGLRNNIPYPLKGHDHYSNDGSFEYYMWMLHDIRKIASTYELDPHKKSRALWNAVKTLPSVRSVQRMIEDASHVVLGSYLHRMLMTPSMFIHLPITVEFYKKALEKARSLHPIHLARILAMTHYAYTNHGLFFRHAKNVHTNNRSDNRPLFTAVLNILREKRPIPHNTIIQFPRGPPPKSELFIKALIDNAQTAKDILERDIGSKFKDTNVTHRRRLKQNRYIQTYETMGNSYNNSAYNNDASVYPRIDLAPEPFAWETICSATKVPRRIDSQWRITLKQQDDPPTDVDEAWVFKNVACRVLATAFCTRGHTLLYDDTYLDVARVFSSLCPQFSGRIYASFTDIYRLPIEVTTIGRSLRLPIFMQRLIRARNHLLEHLSRRNGKEVQEKMYSYIVTMWIHNFGADRLGFLENQAFLNNFRQIFGYEYPGDDLEILGRYFNTNHKRILSKYRMLDSHYSDKVFHGSSEDDWHNIIL
jgi:hypothetical protein